MTVLSIKSDVNIYSGPVPESSLYGALFGLAHLPSVADTLKL